jgi:hypothetical protein
MSAGMAAVGWGSNPFVSADQTLQSQPSSPVESTFDLPAASDSALFSPAALQAMQSVPTAAQPEAPAPPEHHPSGGGLLGDIGGFFSGAAHTVEHAVSSGADSVGNFVTHTIPKAATSVATLPLKLLAGHYNIPAPGLPAYPTLNAAEKQKAMRPGQSVTQPSIRDTSGTYHEPVTLMYHGPLNKLESTLKSQGWAPPNLIPMSEETLNGKSPVLEMQKNAQLGGLSRDHLRVYNMGNNQYGIACTRDLHPTMNLSAGGVSFGHATDSNLNGERDLVMNDILHADPKAANTWQIVQGRPQQSLSKYSYDGQVYEFSLP